MRFAILGPVVAVHRGHPVTLGSGRERFVLASLLLNAGKTIMADALINAVWPAPPASAKAQLHNMVSNLRHRMRVSGDELIHTRPGGYELSLGQHELDLATFRETADDGWPAGRRAERPFRGQGGV